MSDKELLQQEKDFSGTKKLLAEKFSVDAEKAPFVSAETIAAYAKGKRARKATKPFFRLTFRFAAVTCAVLILAGAIFHLLPREVQTPFEKPFEKTKSADRFANTNHLEAVTFLYKAGHADVEQDGPMPMVWVRKGEK